MEDHRRADQKGGFAVHLGGTALHTNARATAAARRQGLARFSTKKVTISFVPNISLAHATSASRRSLIRLESEAYTLRKRWLKDIKPLLYLFHVQ